MPGDHRMVLGVAPLSFTRISHPGIVIIEMRGSCHVGEGVL